MVDSKHQWKAWLYLSPAIILLLIFTVWPIINTLIMAFSDGYSSMKNQRTLKEGAPITVYGTVSRNSKGNVVFKDNPKFYFGNGIIENDADLMNKLFVEKTEIKDTVTLLGSITGTPQYNSSSKSWTFTLEVGEGYDVYKVACVQAVEMTYEFDLSSGDSNRIFVTGKVKNTGKSFTINDKGNTAPLYTLENGTYVAEINLSSSKRDELGGDNVKTSQVAAIKALDNGSTTEEALTMSTSVFSIEKIHDGNHVTLVCQLSCDGQSVYIECSNLQASERTGFKLGNFFFGINNFKQVVTYAQFGQCLLNTMLLTILTVPLSTLLALLIAVCLNAIKPLQRLLQTIFFLPYVTNSIAIGMVFATMFNMVGLSGDGSVTGTIGIVNNIIEFFGGTRINWINQGSSYAANIAVMTIYIVWNALPFKILILLGGLQSVNKQYYDAAKVDGTSRSRTFWRITVPLLSPMIAYVVITGFIGGFKEYSSIVGVFGDTMGPPAAENRLNTMVGFIYNAIEDDVQGKASAAALILFGIILVVTLINLSVSKKKVHY